MNIKEQNDSMEELQKIEEELIKEKAKLGNLAADQQMHLF